MLSIQDMTDMLIENKAFSFARYGDGEWNAIFGRKGANCDRHSYTLPGLKEDLTKTIVEHRPYFYGMQGLTKRKPSEELKTFLQGIFIPWVDADILHHASKNGKLNPFIKALRKKKLCFVGPEHLKELDLDSAETANICTFYYTQKKNCYLEKDKIIKTIKTWYEDFDVFLFSAGFLSEVLIWELFPIIGHRWMIDMGSLWDPYCGINSRTYHSRITDEIKKANFA